MALISVGLLDYNSTRRRFALHVEDGKLLADYDTAATTLQSQLDNVTGCLIEEVTITVPLTLRGANKGAAVAAMEAERGALLTFATAGRYGYSNWVPGIMEAFVVGDLIDTGATEVNGLATIFTAGFGAGFGNMNVHNGHDEDITALVSGRKTFRRK